MQTQALDDLIVKLEESLSDVGDTIEESFEYYAQVVKETIEKSVGTDVNGSLDKIYNLLMDTDNEVARRDTESYKSMSQALDNYKRAEEAVMFAQEDYNETPSDYYYNRLDEAETKLDEAYWSIRNLYDKYIGDSAAILKEGKSIEDLANAVMDLPLADAKKLSGIDIGTTTLTPTEKTVTQYFPVTAETLTDIGYSTEMAQALISDSVLPELKTMSTNIVALNSVGKLINENTKAILSSVQEIQKNIDTPLSDILEALNNTSLGSTYLINNGSLLTTSQLKKMGISLSYK